MLLPNYSRSRVSLPVGNHSYFWLQIPIAGCWLVGCQQQTDPDNYCRNLARFRHVSLKTSCSTFERSLLGHARRTTRTR